MINRRELLKWGAAGAAWAALPCGLRAAGIGTGGQATPNIIIVLADDMGWRDTGYQGSPKAKTPNLDDMAGKGIRFDYFYAAQQMCAPGRCAIMTGRAPFRVGIHHLEPLRPQEITIAKALKTAGYRTGHFGKWHLGSKNTHPVKMGFDVSYYSKNYYDTGDKLMINDSKEYVEVNGDSSVFTMDLALEWIRKGAGGKQPLFAYVAFGSPHIPHKGAEEFKALYKDAGNWTDYLAEVSGIDAAVGKLRAELIRLGMADNTLIWVTSDNGGDTPDSREPNGKGKGDIGVRVVSCLEWPARIKKSLRTDCACVHMDMYPTILDIVGVKMPNQPVLDGISLLPLFDDQMKSRPSPMGFMLWDVKGKKDEAAFGKIDFVKNTQGVWIDGPYKLVVPSDGAGAVSLFNIYADPAENNNLAGKEAGRVAKMRLALEAWQRSCRASYDGKDYQ